MSVTGFDTLALQIVRRGVRDLYGLTKGDKQAEVFAQLNMVILYDVINGTNSLTESQINELTTVYNSKLFSV